MSHSTLLTTLKQELQRQKLDLQQQYLSNRQPRIYFQQHTQLLERALSRLWQEYFAHQNMCLMAIGGFGRGEMYPYSDMDIAIITEKETIPELQDKISAFIQDLWDVHLMPAAKVGSVEQLCDSARQDLTSDTAFLEGRFICGRHQLAQKLLQQLDLQRNTSVFIDSKLLEQQQRELKVSRHDSMLEANIKTVPGGMRNIHTLLWLAKVQGLPPRIDSLIKNGILNRQEARLLLSCQKELAKIRIDLHLAADRPEERLLFDLQTKVARNMGYTDDEHSYASEKLMRTFYRSIKGINQLSDILLPMLRGRVSCALPRIIVNLDEHYYQLGNLLAVRDLELFRQDPGHIFQALEIIQKHNDLMGMAPKTLRAWWAAVHNINADFYHDPANRRRFLNFFKHGRGLTHLLRFSNLYGLLERYLPNWGKIVGLLQHDLFHIYPVDDHILMVLGNLRRLAMEEHSHEFPLASDLMRTFKPKHILYLAALFHDIAKGRGGDHALEGMADAHTFAQDHGLNKHEHDLLVWLVENHLYLSATAQKQDIQNPDVVSKFAQHIQTPERLKALYLLTVADIRGTNPKIWNSWKASLLEMLFKAALNHLQGNQPNHSVLINKRQQRAMHELTQLQHTPEAQQHLWQLLGQAYFVRYETGEILWHLPEIIGHEYEAQAHVRLSPKNHTMQIMVYMPNRPKLFAQLSYLFSQHKLNILAARAYVTEHNYILDTFILQFPATTLSADHRRLQKKIQTSLDRFVHNQLESHTIAATQPLGRRSRYQPIAPRISICEDDAEGWYSLNIITFNRHYLLANIAQVLSDFDISIRYAKITTLDERVEDSFLIYAPELIHTHQQLKLKTALLDQISN
ncbi:[protein-PII] uridylyltransferase [Neisseriaceae bacterium ESL0693]|nr:[protein-PII] uridylyltransferase [Neisseriaceae bacterium ESL0693]